MSGATPPAFRRLIVELSHAGADPAMLRALAGFARLLGLDLHGLFVEDEALHTLAELPFAREIRLPTHEWAPLATDRLAAELRQAAEQARRAMQDVMAQLDVPAVFEILRGDPVSCIADLCCTTDIVVIMRPGSAAAVREAVRLHEAAHGTPASVLLLPGVWQPRSGPVVAMLSDAADPALEVAARIVAAGEEGLLLLISGDAPEATRPAVERAVRLGIPRERITEQVIGKADVEAAMIALDDVRERLIVVTRSDTGPGSVAGTARLAAVRRTPVLVVEPREAAP